MKKEESASIAVVAHESGLPTRHLPDCEMGQAIGSRHVFTFHDAQSAFQIAKCNAAAMQQDFSSWQKSFCNMECES